MPKFLVKFVFNTGPKPKFIALQVIGEQAEFEELNKLKRANMGAYARLHTYGISRQRAGKTITVHKYVNSYGWLPPVDIIDKFMMEEIQLSEKKGEL